MLKVYVVSHTQSLHHIEERVGGWYDTGLTDLGRLQAEKTGQFLSSEITKDAAIFSSDLKRANETAEIIAKHLDSHVRLDQRLREMRYGVAEGKLQLWAKEHIIPQPSDGDRLNHRIFKNAENRRELAIRIRFALDDILKEEAETIVIVSHGFASTFLVMSWMMIPPEHLEYCNLQSKPGGITLLSEDEFFGNRAVEYLCRTTHL